MNYFLPTGENMVQNSGKLDLISPPEKMSSHLLTSGWKYFQLFKTFIYIVFLKHWIMTKNQKLSSPNKNTPSSKPYRTDFF